VQRLPLLADALLFRPKSSLLDASTKLSTKLFTIEVLSVRLWTKPVRWKNNFIKKGRVGKKFSWVGEKNTLLKTLVVALACSGF
jgi:hypothetical protein